MTDYHIKSLPDTETTPADGDYLMIDDVSGTKLKKITVANLLPEGMSASDVPGLVVRPAFEMLNTTTVGVGPGAYHHEGTTEQLVYWDSQLSIVGTDAALSSGLAYMYLDDSAIVTHGSPLLTASEFIWTNTAPTWSASKQGWYHPTTTDDRCIFGNLYWDDLLLIFTDAFFHDGGDFLAYNNEDSDRTLTVLSTTWTDVTLDIPAYCTRAEIIITCYGGGLFGGQHHIYWRTNGLSGTTYGTGDAGHEALSTDSNPSSWTVNTLTVITDSDQKIEVVNSSSTLSDEVSVSTTGYYFPRGM